MSVGNGSNLFRGRSSIGRNFIKGTITGTVFGFGFAYMTLYVLFPPPSVSQAMCRAWRQELIQQKQEEAFNKGHILTSMTWKGSTADVQEESVQAKSKDAVAEKLSNEIRILCWIMTSPSNHKTKAVHVKATWGKRCTKLIFFSSQDDEKLGAVGLPVEEGRNWLWAKTRGAFKYVWENYREDFDWVLKADDDTYVVMENLRLMLQDFNPAFPSYFGCRFKKHAKQGYMSGGAGYVLSWEAVRRFVELALPDKKKCWQHHSGSEDVEIGKCLERVGVIAGDSRDELGRHRFLPFPPGTHIMAETIVNETSWYWSYIYYPQEKNINCCSDYAISYHYIEPVYMYLFEYFLYHLKPYGRSPSDTCSLAPSSTTAPDGPLKDQSEIIHAEYAYDSPTESI